MPSVKKQRFDLVLAEVQTHTQSSSSSSKNNILSIAHDALLKRINSNNLS